MGTGSLNIRCVLQLPSSGNCPFPSIQREPSWKTETPLPYQLLDMGICWPSASLPRNLELGLGDARLVCSSLVLRSCWRSHVFTIQVRGLGNRKSGIARPEGKEAAVYREKQVQRAEHSESVCALVPVTPVSSHIPASSSVPHAYLHNATTFP